MSQMSDCTHIHFIIIMIVMKIVIFFLNFSVNRVKLTENDVNLVQSNGMDRYSALFVSDYCSSRFKRLKLTFFLIFHDFLMIEAS